MKKNVKRLVLSRETIVALEAPTLREAAGGYGTIETQCCATMQPCSVGTCHSDTTPIREAY
ncbi:MAG TPA: hypothetical protein VHN15_04470 [Thermoanaerobaculia bacterium]|nr:hypothetical protein [Thermoanaerobaculia bacterium]